MMLSESSAGFFILSVREVCCLDVPKWCFDWLISVKNSKTRCIKSNLSKFGSSLMAMYHVGSIISPSTRNAGLVGVGVVCMVRVKGAVDSGERVSWSGVLLTRIWASDVAFPY